MFFDLTNPAYLASAPFTFAFKFLMAWICGKIASPLSTQSDDRGHRTLRQNAPGYDAASRLSLRRRSLLGGFCGAFAYVLLYLSKSFIEHFFLLRLPLAAVLPVIAQKAVISIINAIIAVLVAVPVGLLLQPALRKMDNGS